MNDVIYSLLSSFSVDACGPKFCLRWQISLGSHLCSVQKLLTDVNVSVFQFMCQLFWQTFYRTRAHCGCCDMQDHVHYFSYSINRSSVVCRHNTFNFSRRHWMCLTSSSAPVTEFRVAEFSAPPICLLDWHTSIYWKCHSTVDFNLFRVSTFQTLEVRTLFLLHVKKTYFH